MVLNFALVSRSFGNSRRASRKVEITFVVMVLSWPSETSYFLVEMPAFSTTASSRGSSSALLANAFTDS